MQDRTVLLIRAIVPALNLERYWKAHEGITQRLSTIGAIDGFSMYSHLLRPEVLLSVVEIPGPWEHMSPVDEGADDLLDELQTLVEGPESVRTIRVRGRGGRAPHQMANDTYLSISDRSAEPGRADELAADYDQVFGSFGVIGGFAGYLYGPYGGLEEKIYGLALWDTEAALQESISKPMRHELRIYRKMHESETRVAPREFVVG